MHRRQLLKTVAALPAWGRAAYGQVGARTWLGADYWANPLQDWRTKDGRMECYVSGGDRNVFWLTREVGAGAEFTMSVRMGSLAPAKEGWAGFRVGMRGFFGDYRDTALKGLGLEAGVKADGRLFVGRAESTGTVSSLEDLTLRLTASGGRVRLEGGGAAVEREVPASWLEGGVALVSHFGRYEPHDPRFPKEPLAANTGKPAQARGGECRFWFRDWTLEGAGVRERKERAWGPILFNQYTVSRGVMKMAVQLRPSEGDEGPVVLRVGSRRMEAPVEPLSSMAVFRVTDWDSGRDWEYQLAFGEASLRGTIRRDPADKPRLLVGALTCQGEFGFPHAEIAEHLAVAKPDLLLFTGDQLYEANGGYGIQRGPLAAARLDYLRKWYMFGWAWGHLTRDIPCVCLPDDHDVYHGNVWGAAGRRAKYPAGVNPMEPGLNQQDGQDSGGFTMAAEWVNLVQRTQVSHLPDPVDPTPVEQGISVYFTHLLWGGVSFALLEDRKFKSAPKALMPEARIRNGWPQNPEWDAARQGDVAGAELLGARQERFLERWSRDWDGVSMKAMVSQTIFCNLCTLPKEAMSDAVTSKLKVEPLGGYAANEKLTMDHDSNGWPQTPRNRALRAARSCLAVHIAGDQHLGSTVQYGIDEFRDGPFAFCTPAISNVFPRRWYPPQEGGNRRPGSPRNTGDYRDGFGNRMTVQALANPQQFGVGYAALNERAPGFGLVEFDKGRGEITLTNCRRWNGKPFPGWPVKIRVWDNGLGEAKWSLQLGRKVNGLVEVRQGKEGYMTRLTEPLEALPVWGGGKWTVKVNGRVIGTVAAAKW